ncbi:MAG: 4Fe-4S dicluster domain-containing protein [archaeon GB-1867-005]|nr:4Fe-4S dicluster domain-containing protein [Candidatus Culexmicrobium cathedralense]
MGKTCYYSFSSNLLPSLFNLLSEEYTIIGPVEKNGKTIFSQVESYKQVKLNYIRTILPPKKYLQPPREELMRFRYGESQVEVIEEAPQGKMAFFCLHPCDANALIVLDRIYGEDFQDDYYFKRRKNSFIVVLDCAEGDEYCFCESVGADKPWEGSYDLYITPIELDKAAIKAGSRKGLEIIRKLGLKKTEPPKVTGKKNLQKLSAKDIEALEEKIDSPAWKNEAKPCLSCGTCTQVCPTCACFDVMDMFTTPLKNGVRFRTWDSCIYSEFTRIAGGVVFRKNKVDRFKHRYYHKFVFIKKKHGFYGCVGCGRCIEECVRKINPVEVIRRIAKS